MDICEKVSMSLWIFQVGIFKSLSVWTVVVCIARCLAMIMMGGGTFHPCVVSSGWSMAYFSSLLVVFLWQFVVAICEFKDLNCEVWVGCTWDFCCCWGS